MDPNFIFDPPTGHNDTTQFPTNPSKEQTRGLFQKLHDQTRDFINVTLIPWINSIFATKAEIGEIVLGQIPDGSLTDAKLSDEAWQIKDTVSKKLADYNSYASAVDANGLYTIVEYKKADGTLYMKSTLSGGTSPSYTTDTWQFYDTLGTTVIATQIWTITYDANSKITSKVVA